ncbi:hypothetical protein V1J52_07760 [Streptomyces sp. TRM 70351]|nr:hypothetical protein [Streptomyces sp. TRM 70351]MEE1928091.1 hypothetical protein [Streptomyces sp. TRM 70351]
MKRFTRIFAGTLIAALAFGGAQVASGVLGGAPASPQAAATGEDTWAW